MYIDIYNDLYIYTYIYINTLVFGKLLYCICFGHRKSRQKSLRTAEDTHRWDVTATCLSASRSFSIFFIDVLHWGVAAVWREG